MSVQVIVAMAENGVIGRDGGLPWHLPDDMQHFQRTTMGHPVISGRKNYQSIPERFRPLKGRSNVVITHDRDYRAEGALVVHSLEQAITEARRVNEDLFIIGGGQIYAEAFLQDIVDRIFLTVVHAEVDGDVYFPELGDAWQVVEEQFHPADVRHEHAFTFKTLERAPRDRTFSDPNGPTTK
ncbi:MAG: dihydrofolate reductase [Flavobacteriales bacterium]|nr:dihydrofolate reductase [Flavobacteriales bacterium]MCB0793441.1 dihydrofolate reductase [Flavobacteriales bacterium]